MRPDLPSGTVTFLFTDIAGSTRLLRRLGPELYAEALAAHRQTLRDAFAAEGGVEVDTQGDAFFVAFPTASGAAIAARSGQRALTPGPITVRMGLHTGTPNVAAEGYVGIDVHRGARVAALAHGGQVIVSASTAALLEDEPLRDLGLHRLKDFDAPARLFQLGVAAFPPLRTLGAVDLPTPATRFLGRERELFEATTLWLDNDPRLMTIIGPGGTGKTRFAIELARLLGEEADGGTVFVPLAPVREPALVVQLIAERLAASGASSAAIASRIGEQRTHVVLDNLEQLLPGAARPLADLLASAPALRIVATSREPLRIAGECQFDLPPMGEHDAVTLFIARARAVRTDAVDSPAVHELIRRLDGLPLAIELAAARIKLLGPEQLLERIRSGSICSREAATQTSATRPCAPRSRGVTTFSSKASGSCSPGSQSSAAAAPSTPQKQFATRISTHWRPCSTRASSAGEPTRPATSASGYSRRSASSHESNSSPRVRRTPCGGSGSTGCSGSPTSPAPPPRLASRASGTFT